MTGHPKHLAQCRMRGGRQCCCCTPAARVPSPALSGGPPGIGCTLPPTARGLEYKISRKTAKLVPLGSGKPGKQTQHRIR